MRLLLRRCALVLPPQAPSPDRRSAQFLYWSAYMGILLFACALLYWQGVWASLLAADPTFLTSAIVVLFFSASVWAGMRARELDLQAAQIEDFARALHHSADSARVWLSQARPSWGKEYFSAIVAKGPHWRDHAQLSDLLAEQASGPHEMAWWTNGVLLKLGLLGKVIGFSIMAMQLGGMETFDPSQTAAILKTLTGGLGIALLTTITGLTANILLGLQLVRLDRCADQITARALSLAQMRVSTLMPD